MKFTSEIIFWLLIVFGIPGLLAFTLIRYPHKIVRLQGKFYKKGYKDIGALSDEEIDQRYQLPLDRMLMGRRSEFIRQATENPEQYQSLIGVYRRMGFAILLVLGFVLGLLILVSVNMP